MRVNINQATLELVLGDITNEETEAIVNAANSGLSGGGGVDGAIHRAGGPGIMEECRKIGGCPRGEARITGAGDLHARYVIHAVGPIWMGFNAHEAAELLESTYRYSLQLAVQHQVKSISFPSISTGAYRFPLREAAPIALNTTIAYMEEHPQIEVVRFVLFEQKSFEAYQNALKDMMGRFTSLSVPLH